MAGGVVCEDLIHQDLFKLLFKHLFIFVNIKYIKGVYKMFSGVDIKVIMTDLNTL